MKRLLLILAIAVGITAATAGPVSAAPLNESNCVGFILSTNTPDDFHHGEEAERAVAQAEDGRGEEIAGFTSVAASCKGLPEGP